MISARQNELLVGATLAVGATLFGGLLGPAGVAHAADSTQQPVTVGRVAGTSPAETAVRASQERWPTLTTAAKAASPSLAETQVAQSVVLVRQGQDQEAALAVPLAAANKGPLLYAAPSGVLASDTIAEIRRILPKRGTVYLVGGFNNLAVDLVARAGFTPKVLRGATFEQTSVAVARDGIQNTREVVIANGFNPTDLISAAAGAGNVHGALVLTRDQSLSPEVKEYLDGLPPTVVKTTVGISVQNVYANTYGPVVGRDDFETSALAAAEFTRNPTRITLASQSNVTEGLLGAADASSRGGSLVVSEAASLPVPAQWHASDTQRSVTEVKVVGGTTTVSDTVAQQMAQAATGNETDKAPTLDQDPANAAELVAQLQLSSALDDWTPPTTKAAASPLARDGRAAPSSSGSSGYYGGMNGSEFTFCVLQPSHYNICDKASDHATVAENAAKRDFADSLHNGKGDAFRHCYWNARMAIDMGVNTAKGFGDRHEDGDGPENEKRMDLYNNAEGRWFGAYYNNGYSHLPKEERYQAANHDCAVSAGVGDLHTIEK
ncbi:cell wall-binding repeat-containing protein [Kitasatospora sp. NPDC001603]|uniref:cell wall-binding repeat-containing protein n=1 Tax=Kitasatospora sp. NPDC001603 TaxID=3154388 RepID=UPI0033322979